jgi:hypothetical protein
MARKNRQKLSRKKRGKFPTKDLCKMHHGVSIG